MNMGITRGGTTRRRTLVRCAAAALAVGALLLGGLVVPTAASAAGLNCLTAGAPVSPQVPYPVPANIQGKWNAVGGVSGPLGAPTGSATMGYRYCIQNFEGGAIAAFQGYSDSAFSASVVRKSAGTTGPEWFAMNGAMTSIPASDEITIAGGVYQRFVRTSDLSDAFLVAPTGRPEFAAGFTPGADPTIGLIKGARIYASDWSGTGPSATFAMFGLPDAPATCGLAGDSCSLTLGGGSWRFLKDQKGVFGGYQPASPVGKAYASRGAEGSSLGLPTRLINCAGVDCRVSFERADLSQYRGVARLIQEPYRSASTGQALSDEVCGVAGGRCKQTFTQSVVYKLPSGGTVSVRDGIMTRWLALGGEGAMGFPVGNAVETVAGYQQKFDRGYIAEGVSAGGGPKPAFQIKGAILGKYQSLGAAKLGGPLGSEVCTDPKGGCHQAFANGKIWWSSSSGAAAVLYSGFLWTYENRRSAWGSLGYPRGDMRCTGPGGGCYQVFQSGILWSLPEVPSDIVGLIGTVTHGAIGAKYSTLNSVWGPLGYPTFQEDCPVATICQQQFQKGQIWWTPATGAHVLRGGIGATWNAGGQGVGFPTHDEQCSGPGGGCFQWFEKGVYWWSSRTGTHRVQGGIQSAYERLGWAWGRLGYPTSNEYLTPGSWGGDTSTRQDFQHGSIIWSSGRATQVIWR